MRSYRKRQIAKIYKQCYDKGYILYGGLLIDMFGTPYFDDYYLERVCNRAYCSIMNHCVR